MTPVLWHVVCLAGITWLSLLVASLIRAKGWTLAGLQYAMGNRDAALEAGAFAGRAERTAQNNLHNFVFFLALALVGHVAQANPEKLKLGADLFFWSRLAFIVIY